MNKQFTYFFRSRNKDTAPQKKEVSYRLTKWNTIVGIVGGIGSVLLTIVIFWFTQNTETKIEGMGQLLHQQDTLNRLQNVVNGHLDSLQISSAQSVKTLATQISNQQQEISTLNKIAVGQDAQVNKLVSLIKKLQKQNQLVQQQITSNTGDSLRKSRLEREEIRSSTETVLFYFTELMRTDNYSLDSALYDTTFALIILECITRIKLEMLKVQTSNQTLQMDEYLSKHWGGFIEVLTIFERELSLAIAATKDNNRTLKAKVGWARNFIDDFFDAISDFVEAIYQPVAHNYRTPSINDTLAFRLLQKQKMKAGYFLYNED